MRVAFWALILLSPVMIAAPADAGDRAAFCPAGLAANHLMGAPQPPSPLLQAGLHRARLLALPDARLPISLRPDGASGTDTASHMPASGPLCPRPMASLCPVA